MRSNGDFENRHPGSRFRKRIRIFTGAKNKHPLYKPHISARIFWPKFFIRPRHRRECAAMEKKIREARRRKTKGGTVHTARAQHFRTKCQNKGTEVVRLKTSTPYMQPK